MILAYIVVSYIEVYWCAVLLIASNVWPQIPGDQSLVQKHSSQHKIFHGEDKSDINSMNDLWFMFYSVLMRCTWFLTTTFVQELIFDTELRSKYSCTLSSQHPEQWKTILQQNISNLRNWHAQWLTQREYHYYLRKKSRDHIIILFLFNDVM